MLCGTNVFKATQGVIDQGSWMSSKVVVWLLDPGYSSFQECPIHVMLMLRGQREHTTIEHGYNRYNGYSRMATPHGFGNQGNAFECFQNPPCLTLQFNSVNDVSIETSSVLIRLIRVIRVLSWSSSLNLTGLTPSSAPTVPTVFYRRCFNPKTPKNLCARTNHHPHT